MNVTNIYLCEGSFSRGPAIPSEPQALVPHIDLVTLKLKSHRKGGALASERFVLKVGFSIAFCHQDNVGKPDAPLIDLDVSQAYRVTLKVPRLSGPPEAQGAVAVAAVPRGTSAGWTSSGFKSW